MPSPSAHDHQAAENEAFYRELGGSSAKRADWAMTVLFYVAIHLVLAFLSRQKRFLAQKGVATLPRQHVKRIGLLDKHWPNLAAHYRTLEDYSRGARYDCLSYSAQDLKDAEQVVASLRADITSIYKASGIDRSV